MGTPIDERYASSLRYAGVHVHGLVCRGASREGQAKEHGGGVRGQEDGRDRR